MNHSEQVTRRQRGSESNEAYQDYTDNNVKVRLNHTKELKKLTVIDKQGTVRTSRTNLVGESHSNADSYAAMLKSARPSHHLSQVQMDASIDSRDTRLFVDQVQYRPNANEVVIKKSNLITKHDKKRDSQPSS